MPDATAAAEARTVFLSGLAEATAPLILAFAPLAVAWLLVTAGLRRQSRPGPRLPGRSAPAGVAGESRSYNRRARPPAEVT